MSGAWRRPGVVAIWALAVAAVGGLGAWAMLGRAHPPVTHTVIIDASSYRPARLAVRAGDTIVWVNEDVIPHTATAIDMRFDSPTIAAGASWRHTVGGNEPADYRCRFHPTMIGRLDPR